jgi:hypothetical protein
VHSGGASMLRTGEKNLRRPTLSARSVTTQPRHLQSPSRAPPPDQLANMTSEEAVVEPPRKRARLSPPEQEDAIMAGTHQNGCGTTSEEEEDNQLQKELKAGITSYVSPDTPGFTGTLKQRYTDFLVNEILPSGQVLHLQDTSVPKVEKKVEPLKSTATTSTETEEAKTSESNPSKPDADGKAKPGEKSNLQVRNLNPKFPQF